MQLSSSAEAAYADLAPFWAALGLFWDLRSDAGVLACLKQLEQMQGWRRYLNAQTLASWDAVVLELEAEAFRLRQQERAARQEEIFHIRSCLKPGDEIWIFTQTNDIPRNLKSDDPITKEARRMQVVALLPDQIEILAGEQRFQANPNAKLRIIQFRKPFRVSYFAVVAIFREGRRLPFTKR